MAPEPEKVEKPRKWEKAVLVAYLLSTDPEMTQKAAAEAAGCGERTVQRWVKSEWWPEAIAEADARWQTEIVTATRDAIRKALKSASEAPTMARWVGDRLIPALAPPKQRSEITGKDGKPLLSWVDFMNDDDK